MKTPLKVLLVIAGLVMTLAVVLAIAVALLFDPRDYQPLLAESVEKATGRRLTLQGDIGLKVFPCCAVTLERAALGNPPGFPEGEFARVESAALSLKVWPLILKREVQIGMVRLRGLDVTLLVRADGATNWNFGSEDSGQGESAPAAERPAVQRLAIEGVEIRGGRIAYRDKQAGTDYLAEDFELTTGDLDSGAPFDLKLSARITDRSDGTTGAVVLQSRARIEPGFERFTLDSPRIDLTASGGAIPAKNLKATLAAAGLDIDTGAELRGQFRGLQLDFELPELEAAAGELSGRLDAAEAEMLLGASSKITVPALEVSATLRGKDIAGGSISSRTQVTALLFDIDKFHGSIEKFITDIEGLGAKLSLNGSGHFAGPDTRLAGALQLQPLSPRSVLAVLRQPSPTTADPAALTKLGGSADWTLAHDSLQLSKLDLTLDQSRISGSLGLDGFERGMMRFDLRLDAIDLDRYRAPDTPSGNNAPGSSSTADDIPADTLRDLRLDGRLMAGRLTFAKAKLTDISVTVHADAGRLALDPVAAKLYGGEYRGTVNVDASGGVAKLALAQQLRTLQVGPLLHDLYQSDKLTGALSGRIDVTGTGNMSADIIRSLDGNLDLNLADGAYLGTDLWHEIRSARARLKREAPPAAPAEPRTLIKALELTGRIGDGVLHAERFVAAVPFIRLDGAGALNLADKTLDLRLQGQINETPIFEDGVMLKDLTGIAIPLTLKGPMAKPSVGVDLKALATGVATQKLRERLLKKLGDDEPPADAEGTQPRDTPPPEEKPRDVLKRSLRDLLRNR